MVKVKKLTAFFMATVMVASALVVMMPSALAAIDGTAFYDEDYSGIATDYWIDIVDPAYALNAGDDSEHTISFSFSLYGSSFTEVTVSSNGCIQMGVETYISLSNYNFPSSSSYAENMIAPFWDDMDAGNIASPSQDVFAKIDGTKLIVTWYHIHRYSSYGDYTFQAILDSDDSSIRFNYLDMNPDLYSGGPEYYDSPTVGLNKGDGTEYEEYLYDSGYSSTREGAYPVSGTTVLYYIAGPPPGGVTVDGPTEVDEGTSAGFLGSIVGYGVGTPATYSIDDTLIEPFIDASSGTVLRSTSGDDSYNTLTLPFDFEFFGVQYYAGRTIYVSTNGYMDFGDPNTDHTDLSNDNIPSTTDPDNYIAPYWDDMIIRGATTYNSYMYYDVGVSAGHAYLVIEWYNIFDYGYYSNPGTFEVVLWDNNVIDFRYLDVDIDSQTYNSNGVSATVGIENQDGSAGAKYSYNTASLSDGMTIRFEFLPPGGTGYAWYDGSTLLESGSVTADPFYTSLSYAFPDGPATASLNLVATFDGVPIDAATHTVTVNNLPPTVSIDQGTSQTIDLGETILLDGDIADVPEDTYTFWEELTPGTAGVDWTLTPTTPDSTTDEFGFDFAPIRPGVYTFTIYAMDDDGDTSMDTIDVIVEVPPGALEILDMEVIPEDLQAGGMTMVFVDVVNTFGMGNWHQLENGEWWCGDDALGTYDNSWLDALVFEDIAVETDGALRIFHYIDSEGTYDGGNVQISTDDGDTWSLLYPADGYDDASIYGLDSPGTDSPGFTSYTGYAAEDLFDLTAYAGMSVDIRFVFGSDSIINSYEGWTLYSIEIGTMEMSVIPGSGWTQLIRSGTGVWEWVSYADGRYTDPPGTGTYYIIADSDENSADVYDVGVFSPSMDMTGETSVTVTYARDFQDYAGDGYMEVNTYSGGTFQETLFSKGTDDPSGGLTDSHTFNPSGYTDPSDVQIEFLYSTEGGTFAWGFGLDDVEVSGSSGVIFSEDFETTPFDTVGLIFTATSDITDTGSAEDLLTVYVELPLTKDDLVLDLPDGWSVLAIDGPGVIGSSETASLVAALSIPPGTPIGEYDIDFEVSYVSLVWPGDLNAGDDTEHYIDDIGFDFPFYPNVVPPPPPPPGSTAWWCGDDALGTYSPSAQDSLVFQVTLGAGELLTIDHDMDGFSTWDGGNLQVWDGSAWQLVYPTSGYLYDDTSIYGLNSPFTGAPGWSQTMARVTSNFDLGVGTHDIRLVFGSTTVVEYRGWGIFSVLAGTNDITATGVPTNLNAGPSEWHLVSTLPPPTSPARTGSSSGPYGDIYRDISISSNGAIVMGLDTSISLTNYQFPSTSSSAENMIAPFWDDMAPHNGGTVSFNSDGNRAVITWYEVPRYSNSGIYSFQCVLYPNGDIQFNYLTLNEGTTDDGPTVGVNLGDGIHGTGYYYESGSIEVGTRPLEEQSLLFTYDGDQYIASVISFEWIDFGPKLTVNVVGQMTSNDLSFYRHSQNAMKTIVMLAMNLEDGMEDDGSFDSALEDYRNCEMQSAHSTSSGANAHGEGYGYWTGEGGMDYFFNPGKNGNGMEGMTGAEAKD